MKRKIYITISMLGLGALLGTAGASDLENLSVRAAFIAALVWTSIWIWFGVLAMRTKRNAPAEAATSTRSKGK